jgi:hypothetical protein
MISLGIPIEREHHEVATAGQAEIDIVFDTLLRTSDKMCLYKYVAKNVAYKYGKTVTFMPKPLFGDNGSGMHTHQSLWKDGKPLFAGTGYAGLSEMALHYIGGILKHAPALCAICNPTNNSYKRLVPGYEAPVNLAYSARNRSASIRIPTYSPSPKAKRIEYRTPDPAANPYLANSAMLLAGLDGVLNKIHPASRSRRISTTSRRRKRPRSRTSPTRSRARSRRSRRTTRSCSRAACSQGFPGELHRNEEGRVRCRAPAAASLRVLPVLRRLRRAGQRCRRASRKNRKNSPTCSTTTPAIRSTRWLRLFQGCGALSRWSRCVISTLSRFSRSRFISTADG